VTTLTHLHSQISAHNIDQVSQTWGSLAACSLRTYVI